MEQSADANTKGRRRPSLFRWGNNESDDFAQLPAEEQAPPPRRGSVFTALKEKLQHKTPAPNLFRNMEPAEKMDAEIGVAVAVQVGPGRRHSVATPFQMPHDRRSRHIAPRDVTPIRSRDATPDTKPRSKPTKAYPACWPGCVQSDGRPRRPAGLLPYQKKGEPTYDIACSECHKKGNLMDVSASVRISRNLIHSVMNDYCDKTAAQQSTIPELMYTFTTAQQWNVDMSARLDHTVLFVRTQAFRCLQLDTLDEDLGGLTGLCCKHQARDFQPLQQRCRETIAALVTSPGANATGTASPLLRCNKCPSEYRFEVRPAGYFGSKAAKAANHGQHKRHHVRNDHSAGEYLITMSRWVVLTRLRSVPFVDGTATVVHGTKTEALLAAARAAAHKDAAVNWPDKFDPISRLGGSAHSRFEQMLESNIEPEQAVTIVS